MTLRRMTALAVGSLLVIPALAFAVTPALAADRDPGNNTADATYVTPSLGQAVTPVTVPVETGAERAR